MRYPDTPEVFQMIIDQANKAFAYIRAELDIRNLPALDPSIWKIWSSTSSDKWSFTFKTELPKAFIVRKDFNPLLVTIKGQTFADKGVTIEINFNKSLKTTIQNYDDVSAQLMILFVTNDQVTPEMLEDFLSEAQIIPNAYDIKSELEGWLYADSYDQRLKYAERLEKLVKYLPIECRMSPTSTLYRCIAVDVSLVAKVLADKKSLSLEEEDRKYSSWSYNQKSAEQFGNYIAPDFYNEGKRMLVMLRRNFSNDQVLLNVPEASRVLGIYGTLSQDEQEIIIRNTAQDFKFDRHDIYLLKREKGSWFAVNRVQSNSSTYEDFIIALAEAVGANIKLDIAKYKQFIEPYIKQYTVYRYWSTTRIQPEIQLYYDTSKSLRAIAEMLNEEDFPSGPITKHVGKGFDVMQLLEDGLKTLTKERDFVKRVIAQNAYQQEVFFLDRVQVTKDNIVAKYDANSRKIVKASINNSRKG